MNFIEKVTGKQTEIGMVNPGINLNDVLPKTIRFSIVRPYFCLTLSYSKTPPPLKINSCMFTSNLYPQFLSPDSSCSDCIPQVALAVFTDSGAALLRQLRGLRRLEAGQRMRTRHACHPTPCGRITFLCVKSSLYND